MNLQYTNNILRWYPDKGPSEKGTTSLQRTLLIFPKVYVQYVFNFQNMDNLPTRDKMAGPKVSFSSTVVIQFHL